MPEGEDRRLVADHSGHVDGDRRIITALMGCWWRSTRSGFWVARSRPQRLKPHHRSQRRRVTSASGLDNLTYAVRFPSGAAVKFRNHRDQDLQILAAQVERSRVGRAWKFTIS
jgi:hypothetical protein